MMTCVDRYKTKYIYRFQKNVIFNNFSFKYMFIIYCMYKKRCMNIFYTHKIIYS